MASAGELSPPNLPEKMVVDLRAIKLKNRAVRWRVNDDPSRANIGGARDDFSKRIKPVAGHRERVRGEILFSFFLFG